MDEKHRVILSLYYRNPDTNPKRIPDWFCSMEMDITQLLLLTEGIYKESVYKFRSINQRIGITPIDEKDCDYKALIYKDNDQLASAEVINISPTLEIDADFIDACLQNDISEEIRTRNYRLSMLVNNINGTHKVLERDSVEEFCIFSEHGKVFIGYLYFLLRSIIINGFIKTDFSPQEMICFVNRDYRLIAQVYTKHERILNQIQARTMESKIPECMENAAIQLDYWINERKNLSNMVMLGFLFYEAIASRKEAVALINQIVEILDIISNGLGSSIMWKTEADKLKERHCPHGFTQLRELSKKLRDDYNDLTFQKEAWATEYLKKLTDIYSRSSA